MKTNPGNPDSTCKIQELIVDIVSIYKTQTDKCVSKKQPHKSIPPYYFIIIFTHEINYDPYS